MRTKIKFCFQSLATLYPHKRNHHPSSNLNWGSRAQFNSWVSSIKKTASTSPARALKLFSEMQRQSVRFDSFSILYALNSCTHFPCTHLLHNKNVIIARHLHAHLLKLGFAAHVYVTTSLLCLYASRVFRDACILFDEMPKRNSVTWNVMITGYSRQGDLRTGRMVFDTMPWPDLGSWSAIIAAYIDKSVWDQGLALFREMVASNESTKPDQLTVGSILAGCERMGPSGLVLGKSLHEFAIKNMWELNVQLGTCLVDRYAKCGLLKSAYSIFSMTKNSNVISWTALICGHTQHGNGLEALLLFEKMRGVGVIPNELTFTGILTACAKEGLVDEGRRYFRMIQLCGLSPVVQHYGCMIDLFGKAGMLVEAYEMIHTMPFKPNVVIWGSFLSACYVHRQYEMAEKVIDQVMRTVRPENDAGVYSIICDLYLSSGKSDEAWRLRELMVEQNVRKVRGSSVIRSGVL